MLKTIVRKELRELLPFVALALLIQIFLICAATGANLGGLAWIVYVLLPSAGNGVIPFVGDLYCVAMLVVSGLLAVAVGLWQTMWEANRGTFQFLLHRPFSRSGVIAAKLSVGIALCLLTAFLPLVYYAVWAASPGTNASPFDWSMTTNTWVNCAQIPLLYLAAFLCGLREARWFGSRCFPLAAGLLLLFVFLLSQVLSVWVVGASLMLLLLSLAAESCFALVILQVGRTRDFS
ncbi:MAG TPA: hypothetical protein VMJ32_18375 [Pirellulales bacterium]|nr:hypothetical protein [Pirellulales bacterium]